VKLPELLAPAGNMEKAVVAMEYGADAIYLAGKGFWDEGQGRQLQPGGAKGGSGPGPGAGSKGLRYGEHLPRNEEMDQLPAYLEELAELQVDALIIADVGVLALARQYAPGLPLHLSTQANTVNYQAPSFGPSWV